MGTSNGRLLFVLLFGALIGGALGHFLTASAPSAAAPALSPDRVSMDQPAAAKLAGALPAVAVNGEREQARAKPTAVKSTSVSDGEVQSLLAELQAGSVEASAGAGTIFGWVLDQDGQPLDGVVLRLNASRTRGYSTSTGSIAGDPPVLSTLEETVRKAAESFKASRAYQQETRTDATGAYRFEALPDKKWTATAYLKGYQVLPNASGRNLAVGTELDFTGTRAIQLPVSIFAPDGAAADVARLQTEYAEGGRTRNKTYSWKEDEAFLRLVPGSYKITAYSGSDASGSVDEAELSSETQEIIVDAQSAPTDLRFDLRGRLGIKGILRPAKGDPRQERLVVHMLALAPQQEVDLDQLSNSDKYDGVSPGGEFSFQDLEPGRHVVGVSRTWNSPILHHREVEVSSGPVRCDLQLPALDRSATVRITALGPSGEPLQGIGFTLAVRTSRSSSSSTAGTIPDGPGVYLLQFDAERSRSYFGDGDSKEIFELRAKHADYAPATVKLDRGQTEVVLSFAAPGNLTVTVAGYQGSGYEGRLQLQAVKKVEGGQSNSYLFDRNRMGSEGVQVINNLAPGLYTVSLTASPKDSGGNYFGGSELATAEVQVHPGENSYTMQIPTLYSLRVHWADGKEGANMSLSRIGTTNPYGGSMHTEVDASGYATWEDLVQGEYTLRSSSLGGQQMEIAVPCGEVEFEAMEVNALRVTITDSTGDLAKLGFQMGDLIIGTDGEEFSAAPDFGLLGTLVSSKTAEINFLVLRGTQRLNILVKGSDVGDWQDMGGRTIPAGY